jgi:DNA-binding beta-propeller fold protein YncE
VLLAVLAACGESNAPSSITGACSGSPAPSETFITITNTGLALTPLGRITEVGDFPTGGALSPDGRFYWAVDSGDGYNDVQIVSVASGAVVQTLPLPGAFGQMVFAPDGSAAYVSGEPQGGRAPAGPTVGNSGDVIHVFSINPSSGTATEQTPIALPVGSWPAGLAVTPAGQTLVVALYDANKAAIIDLASAAVTTVATGHYPFGVAIERSGRFAYVGNELDGTLTKIDLSSGQAIAAIAGLGGDIGDSEAHVQGLTADSQRDRLYAAVANRDAVVVIDTVADQLLQSISLKRPEGYGVQPVALALTPDDATLYVANAGEDALAAIALTARGPYQPYDVIGKVPVAYYPHDVRVSPDGCTLAWSAAKGFNAGPNPGYQAGNGTPFANSGAAPYGTYVLDMLLGRVGMLTVPSDAQLAAYSALVQTQLRPMNSVAAAAQTPIESAAGGPSTQITHVFLIVRENRTYDQIFGSDPRGDGDPSLEVFDDNGAPAPIGGMTPNAHALSRQFALFDNFYEDSEVSVDGHLITSAGLAIDYMQRAEHPNYSGRGGPSDSYSDPVTFPPRDFIFDQAARQGVSFLNYGESAGRSDDGRSTWPQVGPAFVSSYSPVFGCLFASPAVPDTPLCTFDSGLGVPPPAALSRVDKFNQRFTTQLAADSVPQFNYLILPNDHTNGATPGLLTPQAMVADNDLGLGQLVQLISNSAIWPQTAIFVVEDDSQDGADHVDAHRAPVFVISPWAVHGGRLVHTRYDQYSVVRTLEAILGLTPQYVTDANAVPMYDAFTNVADDTPYTAQLPAQSLTALNTSQSANAALSEQLPFTTLDAVPQEISDRILWQAVYGANSKPPAPGPHASPAEHRRATAMMAAYRRGDQSALEDLGKDHDD